MSAHAPLVELLTATAVRIRKLEAEAKDVLHQQGDEAAYRALMAEKCSVLMDLPDRASALLAGSSQAGHIESQLASYAQRAGQALDLDSVFYQSALLYPDEYQDGDDNDLELFIKEISK